MPPKFLRTIVEFSARTSLRVRVAATIIARTQRRSARESDFGRSEMQKPRTLTSARPERKLSLPLVYCISLGGSFAPRSTPPGPPATALGSMACT